MEMSAPSTGSPPSCDSVRLTRVRRLSCTMASSSAKEVATARPESRRSRVVSCPVSVPTMRAPLKIALPRYSFCAGDVRGRCPGKRSVGESPASISVAEKSFAAAYTAAASRMPDSIAAITEARFASGGTVPSSSKWSKSTCRYCESRTPNMAYCLRIRSPALSGVTTTTALPFASYSA